MQVACAFNEVCVSKDTTQALMNDVFGNYVVQKFLDYGTDEQKARMATMIQGSVKVVPFITEGWLAGQLEKLGIGPELSRYPATVGRGATVIGRATMTPE